MGIRIIVLQFPGGCTSRLSGMVVLESMAFHHIHALSCYPLLLFYEKHIVLSYFLYFLPFSNERYPPPHFQVEASHYCRPSDLSQDSLL